MILSFMDKVNELLNKVNQFIDKNSDNYLFWIILCAIIFGIGVWAISKLSEK